MPNNLLNAYNNLDILYIKNNGIADLLENFNNNNAKNLINLIFNNAGKEKVFDVNFPNDEISNVQAHTINLFLLGLLLRKLIKPVFDNYLLKLGYTNITNDTFSYVWLLTCLYHDFAKTIEKNNNNNINNDLDFYLGNYNMVNNVYNHTWKDFNPNRYSYNLINNYFKYKLKTRGEIDHGIVGGFLLYDRLVKNYQHTYIQSTSNNYDNFEYNNLKWNKIHHNLYAIASFAIIEHNIWFAEKKEDEQLYRQYGLESLIKPKKITKEDNPLLLYLGLLDSIEPLKVLYKEDYNNANSILKAINIKVQSENNAIYLKFNDSIMQNPKFNNWENRFKSIGNWLDVNTSKNKENDFLIKINR